MTSKEFAELAHSALAGSGTTANMDVLYGCGLPDYPRDVVVPRESAERFIRYQCACLDGTVDTEELERCHVAFTTKRIHLC